MHVCMHAVSPEEIQEQQETLQPQVTLLLGSSPWEDHLADQRLIFIYLRGNNTSLRTVWENARPGPGTAHSPLSGM